MKWLQLRRLSSEQHTFERAVGRVGSASELISLALQYRNSAGGRVVTPRPNLLTGWQSEGWARCETTFDALPVTPGGQMRIQLHLVGKGEAWVDDVVDLLEAPLHTGPAGR